MIPLDKCKQGWLYIIKARNASIGIFRERTSDFVISRTKFKDNYLFEEIHYEADASFGTVIPLKEVEEAPFHTTAEARLAYLNQRATELADQIKQAQNEWWEKRKASGSLVTRMDL